MLIGMTGFAQGKGSHRGSQLHLEMRSLNHRFFECAVHVPEGMGAAEDIIKNLVRVRIRRGRITVSLAIVNTRPRVMVNYSLADSYLSAIKQLNKKLKLENNLSLSQIINLQGILNLEKAQITEGVLKAIHALANRTLKKLTNNREREGRVLQRDVIRNIARINVEVLRIKSSVSSSMQKRKQSLTGEEYSAFLKDTDVNEEMVRLGYHVKTFQSVLKRSASCGKELDFIAQEIQREANTISAKAQDARVSSAVVIIKSAVDKIREQLQNAE